MFGPFTCLDCACEGVGDTVYPGYPIPTVTISGDEWVTTREIERAATEALRDEIVERVAFAIDDAIDAYLDVGDDSE